MKAFWVQFKTEFKLHLREPEAIFWGFIFPVLMVVVLGFLFSKKPKTADVINVAINKDFYTNVNNKLIKAELDKFSKIHLIPVNLDSLETFFKDEKFNYGLSVQQVDESVFQVTVLYSSIVEQQFEKDESVFDQLINVMNQSYIDKNEIVLPYQKRSEKIIIKAEKGEDISYVDWLLPGVIGLNLFISCAFGIGINVVQDKKKGKFKKIATTPLPKWQFMLTTSFQRMIFLFLQAITIIIAGYLIFDIKPVGSIVEYFVVISISTLAFMIFGFAIASISNTIEKAVAISNIFFVLSMLLSGAYFPNAGLPSYFKVIADYMPATLCIDATRGIFTFGKSITEFIPHIIGLFIWAGLGFAFSMKFFKWTNE
jgi:ABC-2 type transport system permease protein